MKLAILGVGNLGSALLERVVQTGVAKKDVLIIQRSGRSAEELAGLFGCTVLSALPTDFSFSPNSLVIIAVKPQDADSACSSIRHALHSSVVVLSVMAGVSLNRLEGVLEHSRVARAMPNLGAMIGESATVYTCHSSLTPEDRLKVQQVVQSLGRSWYVEDESLLDVATAVAGSGPAYLCWLAEQVEVVAMENGFPAEVARDVFLQTIRGTSAYLEQVELPFVELRRRVTSPAGTTKAALSILDSHGAAEIFQNAVRAALHRSRQLGE